MQISQSKTVNETISLTADFGDDLASGETITDFSVTNVVFSGTDSNPSYMLYQVPELKKGYVVDQRFRLGVPGVVYEATFSVTTSAGQLLERVTRLAVLPNIGDAIPVFSPVYLSSRPYPLNVTESYQSITVDSLGGLLALQPYLGPESIKGLTTGVTVDVFGSGVTYTIPFESVQGDTNLAQIDIFGEGVTYSMAAESITGDTALMQVDVFGSGVTYSIPHENIRGTTTLTSVDIT